MAVMWLPFTANISALAFSSAWEVKLDISDNVELSSYPKNATIIVHYEPFGLHCHQPKSPPVVLGET